MIINRVQTIDMSPGKAAQFLSFITMEIWVNKVGGNSDSMFTIDVSREKGIFHADHSRRAIDESTVRQNAPELFGRGAVHIFTDSTGAAEFKLTANETLFDNNGQLKWKSLFFSEPVLASLVPMPKWTEKDIFGLDIQRDLIPGEDYSYIGPHSPNTSPDWLRCDLPLLSTTKHVDLRLPVDSNPFFGAMDRDLVQNLSDVSASYSHTLLLGCSGCGKTSACLALARERYVIYLEVPSQQSEPIALRGTRMRRNVWSPAGAQDFLGTYEDVECALYAEVVAHLVVLYNLLQDSNAALTPYRWLMFSLSAEGGTRIGQVRDSIVRGNKQVTHDIVQEVVAMVERATTASSSSTVRDDERRPVLVVDDLQLLGDSYVHNGSVQLSLVNALVNAMCRLNMSVIWSGTRIGVTNTTSGTSAFAKTLANDRQLHIVGQFEYLTAEKVEALLSQVLVLDGVAPAVVSQLVYALQGRAGTCAGFVTHLLAPESPAMQPGAVLGEVLMPVFREFIHSVVITRLHADMVSDLLREDDLGYLFCRTMLHSIAIPGGFSDQYHCLAFKTGAHEDPSNYDCEQEVSVSPRGGQVVRYRYEYQFREPCLQEAVLSYVRVLRHVGAKGIQNMLTCASAASAPGAYLSYAVLLSLLYSGDFFLESLVEGTHFERYSAYALSLARVVCSTSAEQAQEWFRRVLVDPNDCAFSLLPGVPVKHIAIIPSAYSGAGVICVALPPTSDEPPVKTARGTAQSDAVFVHLSCAAADEAIVTSGQRSLEHKIVAAEHYEAMAGEFASRCDVIPMLLEIPVTDAGATEEGSKEVVTVRGIKKYRLLLSEGAIKVMTCPRRSLAAGGPKG